MIFHIIWNYSQDDIDFDSKLTSFENIISAHRDRNHVVYCSRKTSKAVLNSGLLSISGKKALLEITESSREYKEVSKEISVVTHILFDRVGYVNNTFDNNQNIIEISYDNFLCNLRTRPTTLIPENDVDFDLFHIIGSGYLKRHATY
ncbi:hypothetical protein RJD39_17310 [Vibrio scophthalmi]|uniref:hypothetical protein n=1 Tax=Vibrio scophthalmi TaxID=45658 RepID=UPI003873BB00